MTKNFLNKQRIYTKGTKRFYVLCFSVAKQTHETPFVNKNKMLKVDARRQFRLQRMFQFLNLKNMERFPPLPQRTSCRVRFRGSEFYL